MSSDALSARRPRLRSLLFVPGTRIDWLPKARASGADAVILDLEDAVPGADKTEARRRVVDAIAAKPTGPEDPMLLIRVNALDGWSSSDELRAVVRPGLAGVVLPKVRVAEDVRLADRMLGWCEDEIGVPRDTIALLPLLETARSLRDAHAIACAAQRVGYTGAVTPPGGDVERAVGYRWSPEGTETHALRSRVLIDIRAAEGPRPVAGLWAHVDDLAGLRVFAEQNRALGYEGMYVIHPAHVAVVNEVFSVGADELGRLAGLVAAVEEAQRRGMGAVRFEGAMVDEAMAVTARQTLRRHGRGVAEGGDQ